MGKNKEQRLYTTLDAYRAGFLKLRGNEPVLLKQEDKVVFAFPVTITLLKHIDEYENGAMVDAFKYSLTIKSLKTEIYTLRNSHGK